MTIKTEQDIVNLENDIVGKYIEKFVRAPAPESDSAGGGLTKEFLSKYGF